ncbi:MAG TPA: MFS transporter [Acidimicrobiales bacterium]|nr:MFS transporter [Acidimicrobiales bacterium]
MNLRPLTASFLLFGVFWGGWAVAAADVERALHLSTGGFGLLLSVALAGAAAANAVGGALCERVGTGRVLGTALMAWAVLVAAASLTRNPVGLGALVVATIASAGVVDIAMNVAVTAALAETPGRLVAFHARFNAGAAAGAAGVGALLGAGQSWRWLWVAVAVLAVVLGVVCLRANLPAGEGGDQAPLAGALALLRRERLVLLAVAFSLAAMVEGGVDLWGVLFLRTKLASGILVGAGGAVVGYLVATTARISLGPTVGSRGPARGVAAGAGLAAVGAVVLATAQVAAVAAVGLVLAAGGISMCWPLLLAEASAGRARPGPVVGAVSAVGYGGFVIGPTVVGWVAEGAGLRAGLGLLAAGAAFVAVAPSRPRRSLPADAAP